MTKAIKFHIQNVFSIFVIITLMPIMLLLALGIRGYESISLRSSDNTYVYSDKNKKKVSGNDNI